MPSALISGASIAGPALAFWLQRYGFEVTVVERAPSLRPGGQPVDIRGAALDVVARMGLLPDVSAKRTQMAGANILDRNGCEVMRHTDRTLSAGRHDSGDLEIFRDDLSALLYASTKTAVDYLFNDAVTSIDERKEAVRVGFQRAQARDFDIVVGADGIYSGVRRIVFGEAHQFLQNLGAYVGIFTVPNILNLKDWQTAIGDPSGGIMVLPAMANAELRVFMMFDSEPLSRDLTLARQKALLIERYRDFGWEVPRLLVLLNDATEIYFGEIAQIKMPRLSQGRTVLVGDAGYCPSPRSGQGTSLALVGAYVLAAALARNGYDFESAFSQYEKQMRPFVEVNQALATLNPGEQASEADIDHAKNAIELPAS
jgi:2-polyprenyl-6-methoxyphenol hydroxylase-like FAD-dependent oxidoreductase